MGRARGRSVQSEVRARQLERNDWESLVTAWIFNERDRYIFVRHVLDGVHYEQLNSELKARGWYVLSDRHLSRIIGRCFDIIAPHII